MFRILNNFVVPQNLFQSTIRSYAKKRKPKNQFFLKPLEATRTSIASKGFLRPFKPYTPPEDVNSLIDSILTKSCLSNNPETVLDDAVTKFSLLNECFIVFNHSVPNSSLNDINTIGDVIDFYNTPVNTTVPYDAMAKMDLPKNLHVQQHFIRFNPDTDPFGGVSVFTRSSTLVTGLKYKKKYPGFQNKTSWP